MKPCLTYQTKSRYYNSVSLLLSLSVRMGVRIHILHNDTSCPDAFTCSHTQTPTHTHALYLPLFWHTEVLNMHAHAHLLFHSNTIARSLTGETQSPHLFFHASFFLIILSFPFSLVPSYTHAHEFLTLYPDSIKRGFTWARTNISSLG